MVPIEACALLFGTITPEAVAVEKVVVTRNILQSTERFEINPEVAVKTIAESEKEGLELVGFFHSHPAPAAPSSIDRAFMRLWGEMMWLILSSRSSQLAAFQLRGDEIRKATIVIS